MTPRPLPGRRNSGVERDGDGNVIGLGRHVGDRHRHGVLTGIAALEASGGVGGVRIGVVVGRDDGVRV